MAYKAKKAQQNSSMTYGMEYGRWPSIKLLKFIQIERVVYAIRRVSVNLVLLLILIWLILLAVWFCLVPFRKLLLVLWKKCVRMGLARFAGGLCKYDRPLNAPGLDKFSDSMSSSGGVLTSSTEPQLPKLSSDMLRISSLSLVRSSLQPSFSMYRMHFFFRLFHNIQIKKIIN